MNKYRKWIGLLLIGAVIICGAFAVKGYITERDAGSSHEELQVDRTAEEKPEEEKPAATESGTAATTEKAPEMEPVPCPIDFEEVKAQCPDCYAWIRIPDTNIDYPIVQSSTDDAFYLDHNAYGDYEYAGAIFTESYNKKDFTDPNS